jgi:putative transposase
MGFYELKRQLEYKADLYSNWISVIGQKFPSSKMRSNCGTKKEMLKLSERVYYCETCGYEANRDLNAAINIER